MTPGFLCDLFVLRRGYDDEQHHIVRETDDHDIDASDEEAFAHYDEIVAADQKGGWSSAQGD